MQQSTNIFQLTWLVIQRILAFKGSIAVWMTYCLDELDSVKKVNLLLFNLSKAAESKQIKQEVSQ